MAINPEFKYIFVQGLYKSGKKSKYILSKVVYERRNGTGNNLYTCEKIIGIILLGKTNKNL